MLKQLTTGDCQQESPADVLESGGQGRKKSRLSLANGRMSVVYSRVALFHLW